MLALSLATLAALSLAGPSSGRARDKIAPAVLDQMASRGEATFFVVLRQKAALGQARGIGNRTERGEFVVERLRSVADRSQSRIRDLLDRRHVAYEPFYIMNAIRVTAGEDVLNQLAGRPEVAEILEDRIYDVPKPSPGDREPRIGTIEWNIDRIRAPEVWSGFNDRGEGIVVANIDTGVEYDHPALVQQYRGNQGSGNFDHSYNWFDPSQICNAPSNVPCDNVFHGTHTMGTMVGDDGNPGQNQIGVAPRARWIAAKGCEEDFCSSAALLASGQWVLAPTDLNGQNPRPDLRPHIVNNSWGGGTSDPFYQATVDAWIASGIFPQFSNGNSGSSCTTSGVPGAYVSSYSAGAFDINNSIASWSSRGPSAFGGEIKPNIAAPGVNVRSSVPGGGYQPAEGTSMASPHVAGTVALMWSAAPSLIGDIPATKALLDDSAIDTPDLTCGGTNDDNNVWGEGRLDAFTAVDISPRGPTGVLQGAVTQSGGGALAGARIRVAGPVTRTTTVDGSGQYSMTLPVGTYSVTASGFGFQSQTDPAVAITQGATVTRNFALTPAPSHTVSGLVRDDSGNPVQGATVTVEGTPIPAATTSSSGAYSIPNVPEGEYDVRAAAGRCNSPQTQHLTVNGAETLDFALPLRLDGFGYFCQRLASNYIEASTVLPLTGDLSSVPVNLPFSFSLYGRTYTTAYVTTKGFINFLGSSTNYSNGSIPSASLPNAAIYAFWDDLIVDSAASVRTQLLGSAPNRRFVIEWRNVPYYSDTSRRVDFEIILSENGRIETQYRNIANDGRERGNSATLGIENESGTVGFQYSVNEAVIDTPTFGLLYRGRFGTVTGTVTNSQTGNPLQGVRIDATGASTASTTSDSAGHYTLVVSAGTYDLTARLFGYQNGTATGVAVPEDGTATRNFSLVPAPSHSVSGHVRDQGGNPVPNATVTIQGTPIAPATTDANGAYSFSSVPDGDYDFRVTAGRCHDPQTQHRIVDGNETFDFTLAARSDSFGYGCLVVPPAYVEAGTVLPLSGDDTSTLVNLPFPFTFYGVTYNNTNVSTNGHINFLGSSSSYSNGPIPSVGSPNGSVYVHWDDLYVDSSSSVRTQTLGSSPTRRFVIEWRNVAYYADFSRRIDCEIILHENGRIETQYRNIANDARERGSSATIGLENENGTVGFQYSFNEAAVDTPAFGVLYQGPPSGIVHGRVTDANDGLALSGARVRALQGGTVKAETTTNTTGNYSMNLRLGTYTIEVSKLNYGTETSTAALVDDRQVIARDFALQTARAELAPGSLEVIVPLAQTRTRNLTLGNSGGRDLTWQLTDNVSWLSASPAGGTLAPAASQSIAVTADTTGLQPGVYDTTLTLQSDAARQPTKTIPVRLIVPAYYQAVNAGGSTYTDAGGDGWSTDRAFTAGSWGYTTSSNTNSTNADIAGTDEDALYRTQRVSPYEYRFDATPAGTYEVDLRFAELQNKSPGQRLYDVIAENSFLLPAHDIANEVGRMAADKHVFFTSVTDGQLNLRFVARKGYGKPVVNAVRVRHRPDMQSSASASSTGTRGAWGP